MRLSFTHFVIYKFSQWGPHVSYNTYFRMPGIALQLFVALDWTWHMPFLSSLVQLTNCSASSTLVSFFDIIFLYSNIGPIEGIFFWQGLYEDILETLYYTYKLARISPFFNHRSHDYTFVAWCGMGKKCQDILEHHAFRI